MSSTQESTLPEYSDPSPPPFYSVQVSEGEELLESTGAPPSARRAGSYTQTWDCGLEVILSEQNQDIVNGASTPVYNQQGLITGKILFRQNAESVLQVFLKANSFYLFRCPKWTDFFNVADRRNTQA